MTEGEDHRQLARDSLFLLADLRIEDDATDYRVKVRNLSAGGMMAEGGPKVQRGRLVDVHIRNIGWIKGSIAWVQADRFGIAFAEDIDPLLARAPVGTVNHDTPRFTRTTGVSSGTPGTARKI